MVSLFICFRTFYFDSFSVFVCKSSSIGISLSQIIAPNAHKSHFFEPSGQRFTSGKYPGVPLTVPFVDYESKTAASKSIILISKGSKFKTILSCFRSL